MATNMRIQVKPEFDRIISREDEAKMRVEHKMDPATFNYDGDEEIPQRVWLMPIFDAIWDEIKTWDINVPTEYAGYTRATGTHVHAILKAMANRGLITLPDAVSESVAPKGEGGE